MDETSCHVDSLSMNASKRPSTDGSEARNAYGRERLRFFFLVSGGLDGVESSTAGPGSVNFSMYNRICI
jgi:hypothetical protein